MSDVPRPRTILITGFGPFPGMPFNPTGAVAQRLARRRRPAFADLHRIAHVFTTSYAAVDRDLTALLTRHRPDILLMFGVAGRTRHLRIETRARNRRTVLLPDATQASGLRLTIRRGAPSARSMPAPQRRLLAAARAARVPAKLSHDAGSYLCNYLCWAATERPQGGDGPALAAFIHVPKLYRRGGVTLDEMTRAGEAILRALLAFR